MNSKNRHSGKYGTLVVAKLLGVDPQQVRMWCDSEKIESERLGLSKRRIKASAIVHLVKSKGFPESALNQSLWEEIKREAAEEVAPFVDYPVAFVLDVEGYIKSMTFGSWYHIGYEHSELERRQIWKRLKLLDPDIGAPLKFLEIDRLTVESQRVQWVSLKDECVHGLGWLTPLRMGEEEIAGWTFTLDMPAPTL